jgi:hypothetical protein
MSMTPAINEKFLRQEVFSYFVEIKIFYLMFTLRCRQVDFVASISLPVPLLPAINYRGVHDTFDKHKVANISVNFRKNSKWPQ